MGENQHESDLSVAWLAGLLEGEGCFYFGDHGRILIRLAMTDLDVIERAATIMEEPTLEKPRLLPSGRLAYSVRIRGDKAIEWMTKLKPLMGIRRQTKIEECLILAAARPGKRFNSRGGTYKPRRGKDASNWITAEAIK